MQRFWAIPLRAPRLTLVVVLALTAALGTFARSIRVDSSIEELLPAHDPDRSYYEEVVRVFGSEQITVIGVFADDVFAPATLARIDELSQQLAQIDGVHEVLSLTTAKTIEVGDFGLSTGRLMRELPRTPAQAAVLRARMLADSLYVKNVVSADGRAAGISVVFEPMSDEEFIEHGIEEQIRQLVTRFDGPEKLAMTGIPTIKVNGARLMERDTERFIPVALLLVVVVLAAAFRTPRGVLIPLVTVLIGVVWTTGVMVLAGSAINMGTLVLTPLLITIGVAYSIHVVSQYYDQLGPDRTPGEVVTATMEQVALPVLVCGLTTVTGFAAFLLSPIRAIWEFGAYSCLGVAVIVMASFTVVPALLVLLPARAHSPREREESGWVTRLLEGLGTVSVRRPRVVLVSGLAISLACAWGIRLIHVETDYIGFFSPSSTIRTDNELIARRLAGTQPVYVVLDGPGPQSVTRLDVLAAMRDVQDFIDQQPGVDKTISLLDYLGLVRHALQPDAAGSLPEAQGEVDQILLLVSPADVRVVINRDQSRANIIVRTTLSRSAEVNEFARRVEEFASARMPQGVAARVTGTVVLLNRSADRLAWGQIAGLVQVVVVLLGVMSFLFLSVRVGLLSLIPNLIPIIVLFGIMGWTGISLNISTSMIAALAIGIAIDDTIHFLSRFNVELRRSGSQDLAAMSAMRTVGRPMIFTSVALAAGFLVVCLSNFQPVRHFGYLSSLTVGIALAADLLLAPALVTSVKIITVWDLLFLKLGPDPHQQVPLFAGLRPFQAKIVVLMAHLASAARGAFITRRGETKAELYVLLSGRADVREAEGGRLLRTLGRGDVVGEMGMVRQRPRSADVVVSEDAEYLVLDARFLRRLRRRYPRIASTVLFNLTRILSDRLEDTTGNLARVGREHRAASSAQ